MLSRNNSLAILALVCGITVSGLSNWSVADDDDKDAKEQKPAVETKIKIAVAVGKHWIGIFAVPVDEALQSQLGIKDRVIVHQVVPDSPAEKAGLKVHDILLSYGGKDVNSVEDLLKSVNELGDKEGKMVVLRVGKETTLTIKPEDRPAEGQLKAFIPQFNSDDVKELLGGVLKSDTDKDGKIYWRALGPGVISHGMKIQAQAAAFPNGLSLSISKEDNQPAKIVAKKDGKTFEATEDKLDDLPADIRAHAERVLKGPRVLSFTVPGGGTISGGAQLQLDAEHLKEITKTVEAHRKQAAEHVEKAKAEGQRAIQQRIEVRKSDNSFEELRKDIEGLRKEIRDLKKSEKKDPDNESKESK